MDWPGPLIKGTLIQRYKRFLADIELESGEIVTAHCANPGSMIGLKDPGLPAYLSMNDNPKRKLKYSLEALDVEGALVGINTSRPNKLVEEALLANKIEELAGYDTLRREVKYGKNSRIDLLLDDPDKGLAYVEVKNVHLCRTPALAEFPDSVTTRGAKHLEELGDMVEAGHRAVMCYLVQRPDCTSFRLSGDLDPKYATAFERAKNRGVEAICYDCKITLKGLWVRNKIPIDM